MDLEKGTINGYRFDMDFINEYSECFYNPERDIDSYIVDENGKISNVTRVSAYAEFGYKIVPSFSLIAGGGYQYTKNDSAELNNLDIHS